VIGVRKRQRLSIAKYTHRLVERYTAFRKIACGFLIVPFKLEHAKHLKGLTLALSGTQSVPQRGKLRLRVRAEQAVSPLRQKPAEMRMGFEWTAPINQRPTPANKGDRG